VPLKAVASLDEDIGPLTVNHTGQLPSVTISFNLKPGVSLGDAVKQVGAITAASMPKTVTCSLQGTAQAFESSQGSMMILLALAVVVIYIVLGILYESFHHPITILSALPFAGFGALLTLWFFNVELSVYAFVGIIMLVGLVKKNGIMMVDFAITAQRGGLSAQDAIYEASLTRFRPIMMTTLAALMAGLPIALGYGAGGEARRPLGLAVVGGLLFSQTLTLFVTPVFYVYMEKWQGVVRRHPWLVVSIVVLVAAAVGACYAVPWLYSRGIL
jgi:HAE1 family hydrophobic/amphiphilic exporter-1